MPDEPHRETLQELRDRVDEVTQRVARLTSLEEELSERLPVARRDAKAAEDRLARARAGGESILSMAFDNLGTVMFLLPFLPTLAIPVVLVLAIYDACDDTPYAYRATGTCATSTIPEALPASRCELAVLEVPGGGCRGEVRCGATVYDADVGCEMGSREETDSDGDTTTVHFLIARDRAHDPPWLKLIEGELVAEVRTAEGEAHIVLHHEETEGDL